MTTEDDFQRVIHSAPDDWQTRAVFADWLQEYGQEQRADLYRHGIVKRFGVDFDSPGGALTLSEDDVAGSQLESGESVCTHPSGWTIGGRIHEDYYTWVNEFVASHPQYGLIEGNFESLVFAQSEEAFAHFWEHHQPSAWDYHDI